MHSAEDAQSRWSEGVEFVADFVVDVLPRCELGVDGGALEVAPFVVVLGVDLEAHSDQVIVLVRELEQRQPSGLSGSKVRHTGRLVAGLHGGGKPRGGLGQF